MEVGKRTHPLAPIFNFGENLNEKNSNCSGCSGSIRRRNGGFTSDETNAGVATTGMGVTDGNLTFTASEDLGGGMKISASSEFVSRGRGTAITGRNASMFLSGGFGSVLMGSISAGNPVNAYAGGNGRDSETTIKAAGDVDILQYTLPAMVTGLTVKLTKTDPTGAGTVYASNTTGVSLGYTMGALTVGYGSTSYKAASTVDTRTTMGASYDLGMAVVSAGSQTYKNLSTATNTADKKETVFGITAPVGANLSVGITSRKMSQVGTNNVSSTDFGATYSLSKRTSVNLSSESVKTVGTTASAKLQRVKLVHTF
jgi:predicted porin